MVIYPLVMELAIDKSALKVLQRMQPKAAAALLFRLQAIAADPLAKHANVETLQGIKNGFRLRQGDWRAIFELDIRANVMRVTKIGPRGQVYR
jgi:mRNA interferase RelE/StbE